MLHGKHGKSQNVFLIWYVGQFKQSNLIELCIRTYNSNLTKKHFEVGYPVQNKKRKKMVPEVIYEYPTAL